MKRRTVVISGVATALLVAGGAAGGWLVLQQRQESERDRAARAAFDALARGWAARRVDQGVRYAGRSPSDLALAFQRTTAGLGTGPVSVTVGSYARDHDTARATLKVSWTLADRVVWSYDDPVTARRSGAAWLIQPPADRSLWHPDTPVDTVLTAARTWSQRHDILDRDGAPLLVTGKVFDVQIDPLRATPAAATAVERIVGEPAGSLVAKLRAAQQSSSRAPIPVITYRQKDFGPLQARLEPLPGVIYPPREQPLAPSRTFGQPVLGSYGAVTAEMVQRGNSLYAAGDFAGLSGIQGRYDAVLRGTPGVKVTATGLPASTSPLFEKPPVDGIDVRLSLRTPVQQAAETALRATGSVPSALVAVDVKTGQLLAVASSPSLGFDRALQGQYQPGSTLKVATTYSLLSTGKVTPATRVPCTKTVVVDGMVVRNFEGEALGTVPFAADFAHSCNTAFARLAARMGSADLGRAARALGVGADWGDALGVDHVFTGSVPDPTSATEKAASAFGQARTLASPVALAVMAGSVARGSYLPPALVTSPAVTGVDRSPVPLDRTAAGQLRTLMRRVVTDGTALVLKTAPGGPVSGKTGTAEHGGKNPPETRAWFVGWQGEVAFAVLVEQGRSGGAVAAPVAKAFLSALR
ncbi:MAG TPA: penicillin-binding transpeptidase domain-containing protein [Dermatophilaceae bacterium]|nr:penicillin-binding transpeptidase domain-containing protein [Dermatophilaceae bacterium]